MTTPRSIQLALSDSNFFHCYSRCVRQNFLCGIDEYTGTNYEYRKEWIVSRIKFLSEVFSINVWSYAVMSNHYHIVLEVNPAQSIEWESQEVIQRWSKIFPTDAKKLTTLPKSAYDERIKVIRESLSSISKFMFCLNHYISVAANKEENKKGHFWDGRFKLKALHDEAAVITAMAYVDLNPVRANIAKVPESSDYTSIKERSTRVTESDLAQPIQPINVSSYFEACDSKVNITLKDYIELIDMTGRCLLHGKGAIPKEQPPILQRLDMASTGWVRLLEHFNTSLGYVVCHPKSIDEVCSTKKLKGIGLLKSIST